MQFGNWKIKKELTYKKIILMDCLIGITICLDIIWLEFFSSQWWNNANGLTELEKELAIRVFTLIFSYLLLIIKVFFVNFNL